MLKGIEEPNISERKDQKDHAFLSTSNAILHILKLVRLHSTLHALVKIHVNGVKYLSFQNKISLNIGQLLYNTEVHSIDKFKCTDKENIDFFICHSILVDYQKDRILLNSV